MKKKMISILMCAVLCSTLGAWVTPSIACAAEVADVSVEEGTDTELSVNETTSEVADQIISSETGSETEEDASVSDVEVKEEIATSDSDAENEASVSDENLETKDGTEIAETEAAETEINEMPIAQVESEADLLNAPAGVKRLYGADRYNTSINIANQIKTNRGGEKFDTIIVAYGDNFADALSGSYLSAVTDAPILIVNPKHEKQITDWIGANTVENAKVYLLGGEAVVSKNVSNTLKNKGLRVYRLWGKDRYETNLAILKEADKISPLDMAYEDIIVCTGTNFADSLSASATGYPILLVDSQLMSSQKTYLNGLYSKYNKKMFYLLGGPAVVSSQVESQLKSYSKEPATRIYGSTRYETSVLIANAFFGFSDSHFEREAVLTYGDNFPDGLCGGALAAQRGIPLLLVKASNYDQAAKFCTGRGTKTVFVLGGPTLVSDGIAQKMLSK